MLNFLKIKKKISIKSILVLIFILFSGFLLGNYYQFDKNVNTPTEYFDYPQEYKIVTPPIPEMAVFCDEDVPLYSAEVRERLERELVVNTYWHSLTILTTKRANRWFPVIEPILLKNNIPDDFKYLCMIESTLMNLISPAGATGFWQLMKPAAQSYGLEVNEIIDERYHIEWSTEAACKYLKDAFDKYGNWTMAAASYNFGMNGIDQQIVRQKTNNYFNLVLPDETSRYVFRILAAKIICDNPMQYGFDLKNDELYKPYETYEVKIDSSIKDLAQFAIDHGINYKILKLLNPWLRESYLNNRSKKEYIIKLPIEGSINVIPELTN